MRVGLRPVQPAFTAALTGLTGFVQIKDYL